MTHSSQRGSSSGAGTPTATVPIEPGARPSPDHDRSKREPRRPAGRTAEKRAARRVVAAWIANDVAWGLILAWTIRRHRQQPS